MLIRNGMIYGADFRFHIGDMAVRNGHILEISDCIPDVGHEGEEVIDAGGLLVIPGLTDIHFHGCMGSDLNDATDEAIQTMASYERSCGVTTICPATMTLPLPKIRKILETACSHKASKGEAWLQGVNLEGPFISPDKVGAQNPEYVHKPDIRFLKDLLEDTGYFPKLITVAPEIEGALDMVRELHQDIHFSIGHACAGYNQAKAGFEAGIRHMTHMFNAMPGIHHRLPGPIAAACEREDVSCEIISDGIHVHPAMIRFAFHLMGAERMILISDSTRATGLPDGTYELGGQPIYKHDNAAFLSDGTLAGSTTNLYECMVKAISFGIPLEDAIRAATWNPVKALGITEKYGSLETGKTSDILLIDPEKSYRLVRVITA